LYTCLLFEIFVALKAAYIYGVSKISSRPIDGALTLRGVDKLHGPDDSTCRPTCIC